jgi:hypothetical protein
MRIEPPLFTPPIRMDDWRRAVQELLPAADDALSAHGSQIAAALLGAPATKFVPVPAAS